MNLRAFLIGSIGAFSLFVSACAADRSESPASDGEARLSSTEGADVSESPYAFNEPDLSMALPGDLMEISGLAALPDGRLAAVQDEVGIVFVLNPESGAVESREEFAGGGDYEGIAWAGDRLFVIRSNGRMHELVGWPEQPPHIVEIRTPLRGRNDVEGLDFDAANNRLLIALKEDPGSGLGDAFRAIYAFDLADRSLSDEPVFVLNTKALEETTAIEARFKPSSVAVHPRTGEIYVLSATAGAVLILAPDGTVRDAWRLADSLYEQPEGLAFLADGTLFISSEGGNGPGMLYRFGWRGE